MRKRVTAPAPTTTPAPLTTIPAGYAILPFGTAWRPVLVVTPGDGLWTRAVYRELSSDGRTGAVCRSHAEALAVIAAHQAWRERQDEMERAAVGQVPAAKVKGRGHARR